MPTFIDPTGQPTYGIALCARCSQKFPLADLYPDPNSPGLMVCKEDLDEFDPYRLPARVTEDITLPFVRPDVSLDTSGLAPATSHDPGVSLSVLPSTATQVNLSWSAPDIPVQSYRIYRSVDGGAFALLASGLAVIPRTYSDNTVDRTVHFYDYYVTYIDYLGAESLASNTVHVALALTVGSMVTLFDIYHASGSGNMTYTTPGACDVQISPTNFNQSTLPIVAAYPRPTTGKYYWESKCISVCSRPNSGANHGVGIAPSAHLENGGTDQGMPTLSTVSFYQSYNGGTAGGISVGDGSVLNIPNGIINPGDVINVAVDYSLSKVWVGKNGVWQGTGTQNPVTGQGGFYPTVNNNVTIAGMTSHPWSGPWHAADFVTTPETVQYRFTQAFWTFTPPTGFGEFKPWVAGPSPLSTPPFIDPNATVFDFQNFLPGFAITMLHNSTFADRQFRSQVQRGTLLDKRYFEVTMIAPSATTGLASGSVVGLVRNATSSQVNINTAGVAVGGDGVVQATGGLHGVYGAGGQYQSVDARSQQGIGGGDILMVAVDFIAQRAYFGLNGTWFSGQDPTSGVGGIALPTTSTDWLAALSSNGTTGTSFRWAFNTGGLQFNYKPAGYFGWDE